MVAGSTRNSPTALFSWPKAGRPTYKTFSSRSSSTVPSTLRSGRAPRGSSPDSSTSTVTVPFWAAGSMRMTLPGMMPLRVSTEADLADGQVAGLGLGDAQLGLQAGRVGDAGHVGAGGHLLADFDRHLFEHAAHAGAHPQLVDLLAAQVEEGAQLIDAGLLGQELGAHALLRDRDPLLFELRPGAQRSPTAPSTA